MNKKLALVVAVLLGALSVVLINLYVANMKRAQSKGWELVRMVVAASDLAKGTVISEDKIQIRPCPQKFYGDRSIPPEAAVAIIGATLKYNIKRGDPILWSDLVTRTEADEGLAGDIAPNMCAMTIPVTQISGMAGMLTPGMRVDVIVTLDEDWIKPPQPVIPPQMTNAALDPLSFKNALISSPPSMPQSGQKGKVNVLLLQNIMILATGSQRSGVGQTAPSESGYSSVTLMLQRKEAQILTLASAMGQVGLLLRKAGDMSVAAGPQVVDIGAVRDFVASGAARTEP